MNPRDKQILSLFSARVRALFPEARIWAFGSRARGTADEESDLDVCIVLDDNSEAAESQITHIAWEVGFENEMLIMPVVYSRADFESGILSFSPLVRMIRREGVAA